jgi:hypothetical protein
MQPVDQARVSKLRVLFEENQIKAQLVLYQWVREKVINFETFNSALDVFDEERKLNEIERRKFK